jgi:hypothetical protein
MERVMKQKLEQFPQRFKGCRHELQHLRLADPQFGQLWQDYCDILKELGTANELLRLREELEKEIDEALGIG